MSYDWAENWVPYSAREWPARAKHLGMMFMFEFELAKNWHSDGQRDMRGRIESTEAAWVKQYFRSRMGIMGSRWWTAGVDMALSRIDIFTDSDDWLITARLVDDYTDGVILRRIRLVEYRHAKV